MTEIKVQFDASDVTELLARLKTFLTEHPDDLSVKIVNAILSRIKIDTSFQNLGNEIKLKLKWSIPAKEE